MPDKNKAVIHIRCNAAGKIKREKRDGRETIILPSYAAKADSVLNGILYPRDELDRAIAGLDRVPAPLGHPMLNGRFVPALDPEALARNHVFAWNENPRWDGDRIALDVVIDEARAMESEGGKQVLNAIEGEEPISTSTGLFANLENTRANSHKSIARDIIWDHVAILMDEAPAIGPEEGVGIFANRAGGEIKVINSALDDAERELDWAADYAARAAERLDRIPLIERIKAAIMDAVRSTPDDESTRNKKEPEMSKDNNQTADISANINAKLAEIPAMVGNAVAEAMKPLLEANAAAAAAQEAKDSAEKTTLVNKLVEAKLLTEPVANALDLPALRELVANTIKPDVTVPGFSAAPLLPNGAPGDANPWAGYDLNANIDGTSKKEAN